MSATAAASSAPIAADIVIVGGGPVGLTLAALLARQSQWQVCVLDARERWPAPDDARIDTRVFALSRASQRILQFAEVWSVLQPYASPYRQMRVWDADSMHADDALVFDAAELAEPDLGHIVESTRIEHALRAAIERSPTVRLIPAAQLHWLELDGSEATAQLADGRRLRTRLVVGADGATSTTRQLAGIERSHHDYRQRAIVTRVTTTRSHRQAAWQRFLRSGPLAFLPLRDGSSSIVWSMDAAGAQELLDVTDAEFCARLSAASERALGDVVACTERLSFPLYAQHARAYCTRRAVLIGDAAHVVHPLAGQGLNMGLLDAAALAQCIVAQIDPGERAALRRFERWRKSDNLLLAGALDAIRSLFANTVWPIPDLRGTGMRAMNRLGPVRRALMRRGLGLSGELPDVAR